MKSGLERAIERLGVKIAVEIGDITKTGRGLICPMRIMQKQWGGVEHIVQGRSEPQRYMLYCSRELTQGAGSGSIVSEGGSRYIIVWKDEYSTRLGGYSRICMRKADEKWT